MFCSCGHENPSGAKFCLECSVPLGLRCPGCEAELPATAKFCLACGTPVAKGEGASRAPALSSLDADVAHPGERRQLTVLFCDLVGSTPLAQQLDPEDWQEILAQYHTAAGAAVARWGGHVAKNLGDGILVYFGWPTAREDDPERAVRAGLAIIDAMAPLNALLGVGAGTQIAVRIGMDTGQVVIGGDGEVFGETANVAARVQGVAEPDSVVITASTRRLVAGMFVVHDRGREALKGVRDPVSLYRVLRESAVRGRLEVRSLRGLTPLVDREVERHLLLERWAQASSGEGQVVLVAGEPGIGKSRLLRFLREHIADQPHRWLEASCSLYMQNTAFQPIIELVEHGLGFNPDDEPAARARRLAGGLGLVGMMAPETHACLASFLSLPHAGADALAGLSPEARRRRTIDALVQWIVALSEREPLVLLVEDLHWGDPSTLELLSMIIERTAAARIYAADVPTRALAVVARAPARERAQRAAPERLGRDRDRS